ncbi:MAG: extracellular solute-binding protein [Proteobacteria bacterium]|nr:extracellular solute-binding protein [Pseudomonadota bacterium]
MDVGAFKDRLRGGKLSRRQLQGALGAAGLTALAMPLSPARAATDLTLFEWNGYELPEFHPEYTARYGGEPEVSYFADEEEALQKMRAGFNVDLSHPCTASVGRWRDAGIIKPIDTTRIARWDEIIPDLFKPKGLVHEGQNYFMPWDFGYSAIGYNPAIIDVADPTFEIMVDPRFAGRVSMNGQLDVAVAVGGVIGGFADPFDPTDEEMVVLEGIWRRLLENSRFVWSDISEYEQAFASGEIGAAYIWTSSIASLGAQGIELVPVAPILPWVCGFAINVDGPGTEQQAYDYLNAMLDPEGGAALIELYGYGHANANSYALVDPDVLKANGLSDPVGLLNSGIFFDEIPQAKRERLIAMWDQIQAGI